MASGKLRTMVVLGSTRNQVAPWGGPPRLGDRVGKYLVRKLKERTTVHHEIDYIDLKEVKMPLLEQAHHWYKPGTAPEWLDALANRLRAADSYVLISPEYNHSMSPALVNFLDHFGGSTYAYKPSLIAVYSAGPFGGVRGAMQLLPITHGLGCLSITPVFAAPEAQKSLDENGNAISPNGILLDQQSDSCFTELEVIADAFKTKREQLAAAAKKPSKL